MRVVFLHPDLGIGGAERLVVDAAVAVRSRHHVVVYTTHHHPHHCFPETRDGTLQVVCVGDWLPRSVLGKGAALCAYLRMLLLGLYVVLRVPFDVAIVDQVSVCVPLLRAFCRGKVLFYCHYPDLLLTTRKTFLKKIYRGVLDAIEEWSTSCAHKVLVNSAFTAGVFKQTFKSIKDPPAVLYPSLNTENFLKCPERNLDDLGISVAENGNLFVSVNRFERKKNLGLALHALRQFLDTQDSDSEISTPSPKGSTPTTPQPKGSTHLVIAGGYDTQNRENIDHYEELVRLSSSLNLDEHVTFLKSPDEVTKVNLLRRATCLIYTPDAEHFGIVPIESMFCGTPVIGVNSGGPTETVVPGVTGYLCPNTPEGFAAAMREVVPRSREMGEAGKRRVKERFSFERFSQDLTDIISELAAT